MDLHVFGLFIQWLYTRSLINKFKAPAYQHRFTGLWVLGKTLDIPTTQNDAIDMLELRRTKYDRGLVDTRVFDHVYARTVPGDGLRRYLVDVCAPLMHTFLSGITKGNFPKEMLREIADAKFVELEEAGGEGFEMESERDMAKYYVAGERQYNQSMGWMLTKCGGFKF